jgi:hypothetical protein
VAVGHGSPIGCALQGHDHAVAQGASTGLRLGAQVAPAGGAGKEVGVMEDGRTGYVELETELLISLVRTAQAQPPLIRNDDH